VGSATFDADGLFEFMFGNVDTTTLLATGRLNVTSDRVRPVVRDLAVSVEQLRS